MDDLLIFLYQVFSPFVTAVSALYFAFIFAVLVFDTVVNLFQPPVSRGGRI